MDLPVYMRVLWRFRWLVLVGVVAAAGLSVLSVARIGGSPFLRYRKSPVYVSYSKLFVTQQRFPWGSLNPPVSADPSRFTSLAILYSQLATSDPVQRIMLRPGPLAGQGSTQVAPVLDPANQQPLPIISIAGFAETQATAVAAARRQMNALLSYIRVQQSQNAIPDDQRVELQVVQAPVDAKLFKGQKKTLAIVVFLGMLVVTFAAAFVLENLRPRPRRIEEQPLRTLQSDAA